MLSIADLVDSLREHNARALDELLHERFGGQVGRGLAVELRKHSRFYIQAESLFAPALTGYSGKDESSADKGHNADTNISLQ
jgi:hypothetical protein